MPVQKESALVVVGSPYLSEAAQRLALANGYKWAGGEAAVTNTDRPAISLGAFGAPEMHFWRSASNRQSACSRVFTLPDDWAAFEAWITTPVAPPARFKRGDVFRLGGAAPVRPTPPTAPIVVIGVEGERYQAAYVDGRGVLVRAEYPVETADEFNAPVTLDQALKALTDLSLAIAGAAKIERPKAVTLADVTEEDVKRLGFNARQHAFNAVKKDRAALAYYTWAAAPSGFDLPPTSALERYEQVPFGAVIEAARRRGFDAAN